MQSFCLSGDSTLSNPFILWAVTSAMCGFGALFQRILIFFATIRQKGLGMKFIAIVPTIMGVWGICFASWAWSNISSYQRILCAGELLQNNYTRIDFTRSTGLKTIGLTIIVMCLVGSIGYFTRNARLKQS